MKPGSGTRQEADYRRSDYGAVLETTSRDSTEPRTTSQKNRVGIALRQAAISVQRTQTELGGTYRHLKARLGAPKAITAVANKIGRLAYSMLKNGTAYVERGLAAVEELFEIKQTNSLHRLAQNLGYDLVPKANASLRG